MSKAAARLAGHQGGLSLNHIPFAIVFFSSLKIASNQTSPMNRLSGPLEVLLPSLVEPAMKTIVGGAMAIDTLSKGMKRC